ncbi:MAG: hypothetical protein ACOCVM_08240, partial [Desulfovibrionaceae bacterium]
MAVNIQWTLSVGLDGPAGPNKTQGVFSRSFVKDDLADAKRQQRYQRLQGPLTRLMERKLEAFQRALDQFEWPQTGSMTMAPDLLAKSILASLPTDGNRERTVKHASRGFEPTHPVTIEPGAHEFVLKQGGSTDRIAIDVEANWTNADLLRAVSEAINDSVLPVHAEVVTQAAPGQRVQGLLATGQALVVTLNQAEADQSVALQDTAGHLVKTLDLKTLQTPLFSAEKGVHNLQGTQVYRPSSFASTAFDPGETTSLPTGTRTLSWEIGGQSRTVSYEVEADDTWEDVLKNMANAINSSQSYMAAETFEQQRPSTLLTNDSRLMMDGLALRIEAVQPKRGWRLSLSGDDLATLGMSSTAQPGGDAHMTIDGTEKVRSPGVFAADQGRLLMALSDSFGDTLPLRVVSAIDRLESVMSGVVNAYNDLRKTLVRNEDLLQDGFADRWRAPVASQEIDLKSIGLQEFGKNDELWLNRDAFHKALGSRPAEVRRLLADGPGALIPTWEAATREVLKAGPQMALLPQSQIQGAVINDPPPRTENELAKGAQLLDLYDALPDDPYADVPAGSGGSLMDS